MTYARGRDLFVSSSWIIACALLAIATGASAQTSVTSCGQLVTDGVLANDLDCSGLSLTSVTIANHGSFDLNGFTITGGLNGAACDGSCTVTGPGTLQNAEYYGIIGSNGEVTATGVTLLANHVGIWARRLSLQDSTVSGSNLSAVAVEKRARISGSNIVSNGDFGVLSYRRVDVTNSVVSDNEYGISAVSTVVSGSTIQDNEESGLFGRGVKLSDSTVTGNGLGDCDGQPAGTCVDVTAQHASATNVTCNTSAKIEWPSSAFTGGTLGICTND